MEKHFKLKQNNTTVRTEILAGLTTFMTMSYVIALNPNLLTNFNTQSPLWKGVFLATCISSALGTICMAFLANKPFAMAPSMGLNTFFAVVVTQIMTINEILPAEDDPSYATAYDEAYIHAFQAALSIILIEGIVFLFLSILDIREKIVEAIPVGIRLGIGPAIGIMLMNIGFGSNVGIDVRGNNKSPFYVMRDFFGAMSPKYLEEDMGPEYKKMVITVITMFIGLIVIITLSKKGIKAAVLIGMLSASIIYWICEAVVWGTNPFASLSEASFVPPFKEMIETTFFKFDFKGLFNIGVFTAISLIITFCIIDMFDTIGTLVGTASKADMVDKNGKFPNMKEALLADAYGTIVGSCTGTSTISSYVESASGVEAGGRTGLTALTTGIMFFVCMFIAPIAAIIPAAATSSALIYVGVFMLQSLKKINFDDIDQFVPVSIMLIAMPISGSIGHAIGLALISYTFIKLFSGKGKEVSVLTYVISLLFIIKFFFII